QAFPEDHRLDLSGVGFLAVPVEEVRSYFARFGCDHGVVFVEGYFKDTLPTLRGGRWSVARLDGDTYEATWVGLDSLYSGLSPGGCLIVDDYGLIPECHAAVHDFRREHEITEPIERIDFNGIRWRKESAAEPGEGSAASPPRRDHAPPSSEQESA